MSLAAAITLAARSVALAEGGVENFQQSGSTSDPWAAVATEKISLVNIAPGLLPYFNNAPVFGLPGTELGDWSNRSQLTGDWGGTRTTLARDGWFFDLYSTSTYQDVTAGGLKTGNSFVENVQLSVNLDTARAGLWAGGVLHFTAQARYGSSPQNTFTVGAYVPQYTGLVLPGPLYSSRTYPSEYYLAQAFSPKFSAVLGKISDVFIPDQTLFGNSYKYYFANFNLNKNPMTTNFYHPTALAALGVWTPSPQLAVAGGVLDTESSANTLAENAFDHVNLYLTAVASYKLGELPGQFSPAFNYSNKPKVNLERPFGALAPAQIPQAVGALVGSPETDGLPFNYKSDSWFAIANVSQYLFLKDTGGTDAKMRSGQPLRGVGVFGRFGYAPESTNPVTFDASVALFARGLADARPYDSFGIGLYYNQISRDLKDSASLLTGASIPVNDEKGLEVFYDFAVTPAIRIIPSYQHMWDPLLTQVATSNRSADVFLARVNVVF